MASVHVRTRVLPDGSRRHDVRYRRGGRGYRVEHAGTFTTRRDALTRKDLVAGWLAAGLDPRRELERLRNTAPARLDRLANQWLASRVDLDASSRKAYAGYMPRILDRFGHQDPHDITPADVIDWIADMNTQLAPATTGIYVRQLRMILDALPDNPARHRSVRLPKHVKAAPEPPDADELVAMLNQLSPVYRLAAVLLEQTAMRVSEAINLAARDIDRGGHRLRVRAEVAKRDRARWVDVPEWLMPHVHPLRGVERTAMGNAMRRASQRAGVANINPHLLRHRRATLWHQQGVVAAELARRLGHARASMSLDTYSHVRPLTEAHPSRLLQVLVQEPEHVDAAHK